MTTTVNVQNLPRGWYKCNFPANYYYIFVDPEAGEFLATSATGKYSVILDLRNKDYSWHGWEAIPEVEVLDSPMNGNIDVL